MSSEANPPGAPPRPTQFGLGAMLGCFVALAMALAYLRRYDSTEVFANGAIVLGLTTTWGLVIGSLVRQRGEVVFWSVMVAAAGYLSVVDEMHYGIGFHFAWSAVGAGSGAGAAAIRKGLWWRMLASCLGGTVPMLIYFFFAFVPRDGLKFDLLAAVVVGALIGLLVEIIRWLETQSRVPRFVTATWLLCAVIVGNLLVPLVRG